MHHIASVIMFMVIHCPFYVSMLSGDVTVVGYTHAKGG